MTTRFENGIVVTLGQNNQVIWNGSVVTEGKGIVAVGSATALQKQFPNAEVVDCSGKIVLPGFVCAHHHFYSTMARGMAIPGEPASNFIEILERLWWKVDRALLEDDITLSAQIPLIECIRNGTTTKNDLVKLFGEPVQVGIKDGDQTWTWYYAKKSSKDELSKQLEVTFNAAGVAKSYSFSSNFPEDMKLR